MALFVLTGEDTLIFDGQPVLDLMDGSVVEITFPNTLATGKIGKSGNSIIAENKTGGLADMKLRIPKGSADDVRFLGFLNQQLNNFTGMTLHTGQFTKNLGDGSGGVKGDSYVLAGGYFIRETPATGNVEGNTDQGVSMYELQFTSAKRAIA